jgi:murein DD-endopeptidase MepM/ murein hydrolase activator NlpD
VTRPTNDKRASSVVLAVAVTAVALISGIPAAAALDPVGEVVAVTTTIVDAVADVADEVTGAEEIEPVTGSSTSTTAPPPEPSPSSSTTTTTTMPDEAASATTVPEPAEAQDPRADRAGAAVGTSPPTTVPPPAEDVAGPEEPGVGPVPDRVDVAAPAIELPASMGPAALPLRAGPRSTVAILDVLRSLEAPPALVAKVLAPFPVAGPASYSDDWGAPRHGPPIHSHQGTDIFAERGTPVIASADGTVSRLTTTGALGGTSLRLTAAGGTYFYYAHLDGFAAGLANGDRVAKGAVLGFVGNTGNARTTPPHLHYEVHPAGGAAVPPVPYLDRWLDEAAAAVGAISAAPSAQAVVRPVVDVPAGAVAAPPPAAPRTTSFTRVPTEAEKVNPLPLVLLVVLAGGALRAWQRTRRAVLRASRR